MRAKEDHDQQEVHDGADEQYITMLAGSIKDTQFNSAWMWKNKASIHMVLSTDLTGLQNAEQLRDSKIFQ